METILLQSILDLLTDFFATTYAEPSAAATRQLKAAPEALKTNIEIKEITEDAGLSK